MTLSEYANTKYSKGKERDSFYQRWKGYDLDTDPVDFFKNLISNTDYSYISHGITMLGELEIHQEELEMEILKYGNQLLSDFDFIDESSGKSDIFESVVWILGEIGTTDSQKYISKLISDDIGIIGQLGNFEHILSACQYSFFQIVMRELGEFFKRTVSIKKLPIKTQLEIDALRKLNPKYAEFLQFMLDKYQKYEGGVLN